MGSGEEATVVHHHHESNQQSYEPPPPPNFGAFQGVPSPAIESRVVHHHHESSQQSYEPPPPSQQSFEPPPPPPVVPHYGTFQGVPSSPAMGFPQPAPPPGSMNPPPDYYARGYQSVPGYVVAQGRPVRDHHHHHRLPCCGIGYGWFLFIIGFFLAGFPWYAAAIFLIFCRNVDPREKPAYICCTIAAVLALIATIFGVTRIDD